MIVDDVVELSVFRIEDLILFVLFFVLLLVVVNILLLLVCIDGISILVFVLLLGVAVELFQDVLNLSLKLLITLFH